ncbi:uncharacterized protein PFL1_05428 [Pseudozyma flocculosa PF-1]|uniref:Uncharacterized protein n=2 Tax=Pseudozyma flocculosa TaxID=84751 RepID=A0A5C3FA18_9BASI|nr:uncharacterized protein PFL1_05428 [Pseudozyma flocculosa PF-1]EPQ27147.1 hypothetical protein PFL1_05428 [Pseudozyma flocculosa PF-1]SPO41272.1 uncharacterized protein PSFLO_06754 [Pseudozyma flocculosa]
MKLAALLSLVPTLAFGAPASNNFILGFTWSDGSQGFLTADKLTSKICYFPLKPVSDEVDRLWFLKLNEQDAVQGSYGDCGALMNQGGGEIYLKQIINLIADGRPVPGARIDYLYGDNRMTHNLNEVWHRVG